MYKYGMRLRGFSIGCQPMDGLRAEYMSKGVNICSKEYMDGFYMPDMSLAVPLYC